MGADKTQAITLPSVTRFARIVLGWETTDMDTLILANPFTAWQRDEGAQTHSVNQREPVSCPVLVSVTRAQ
jgi:hypothetical protein